MIFNKNFLFALISSMLAGLAASFQASVLIYFKQKPALQHGLVLLITIMVFASFEVWFPKTKQIPVTLRAFALLTVVFIASLFPQFLYQVRPYTFYISGLAMIGILLLVIAARVMIGQVHRNGLVLMLLFMLAYFVGTFFTEALLRNVILLLSIVLVIAFILENKSVVRYFPMAGMVVIELVYWQFATPINYFERQKSYEDKVVFSTNTQYHDLVITQWQRDYWFFIDKLKNVSSIDEYLYYEPMVHSVMKQVPDARDVLVVGGENGCLIREVLKWKEVTKVDVVSYDSTLRNLGMKNKIFLGMNESALHDDAVNILREDLFTYLTSCEKKYKAVFIDLPDPRDIETNQYYTIEFYGLIRNVLADGAIMITQAGSPYFATQAYFSIGETLRNVGFSVLPLHNQILTLGEWGWYICSADLSEEELKKELNEPMQQAIQTRWYNDEAARLVSSFGKTHFDTMNVGVNTLDNPLVYQYYLKGNWKLN